MTWDAKTVEDELILAFTTLRKVPDLERRFLAGLRSNHPEMRIDEEEKWSGSAEEGDAEQEQEVKNRVRLVASPTEIDAMNRAFDWFWFDIPVRQKKVVGWRMYFAARGWRRSPWGRVSERSGIFLHRTSMKRLYDQGLATFAKVANGAA